MRRRGRRLLRPDLPAGLAVETPVLPAAEPRQAARRVLALVHEPVRDHDGVLAAGRRFLEHDRAGGDADAGGQTADQRDGRVHPVEHPFERPSRLTLVACRQQQTELVAAQTSHGVGRAYALAQGGRDAPQELVAGRVPERVVHRLEVVEIEIGHREGLSRAP